MAHEHRQLHVYVDETLRDLPGRHVLGAGALIVTEPVGQGLIDRALTALRDDPDRQPSSPRFRSGTEKRDLRTLGRGYFHASDDSVNAKSPLARAIKNGVSGKFECAFAEGSKLGDEREFGRQSIMALLPALREGLPMTITFEQRSTFGKRSAEALVDWMNRGLDWSGYEQAMMRTFYPLLEVRVAAKSEPGLQVVDLLLWGALQDHLEPDSHKARMTTWCGGFRWAHGGATPYFNAKYFVNRRSPFLTGRSAREVSYPVKFDILDDGDSTELANDYCMIERIVRRAATEPLPSHAEHLRAGVIVAIRGLREPRPVRPDQIAEVVRQFLRLFDTVPLYGGLPEGDAKWLPLVRAKRMAGLCLREDLLHGGQTIDFFATMRNQNIASNPAAFGLPH